MVVLIVVLIVVVVGLTVSGAAVATRRRRGPELEPPPTRPSPRPAAGRRPPGPQRPTLAEPPPAATAAEPAVEEAPPAELTPEQVAEVEAALGAPLAPTETETRPPAPESTGEAAVVEPEVLEPEGPEPELAEPELVQPEELAEPEELVEEPAVKPRFRDRLGKARSLFSGYFGSVRSRGKIDRDTWDELEEALIRADVGVETTMTLLDDLRSRVKQERITDAETLLDALKADMVERLGGDRELRYEPGQPNVWLFVGVNGVGKTTTIGKLGRRERELGRSVVMAAGDTFRAAAADQLELWAKRVGADLVRGAEGGDPGAVVFDAVERSAARNIDLVLADTAGRLHTKVNLMEELKKVRRVAERPPARLTEVLLVLDATTGQNGLVQAKEFAAAVGVTGVVLTKLDGTAKGGIALAIQCELGIPIKLVGLGEGPADLVEFDADEFVDALFEE